MSRKSSGCAGFPAPLSHVARFFSLRAAPIAFYLAACLQGTQALEKTMRYALRCPQVTPPWSLWTADSGKSLSILANLSWAKRRYNTHSPYVKAVSPLDPLFTCALVILPAKHNKVTSGVPVQAMLFRQYPQSSSILVKGTVEYPTAKCFQMPLGRACVCVDERRKKRKGSGYMYALV